MSAGDYGQAMRIADITGLLIPRLGQCRVSRVTLTGGEPFAHPHVIEIVAAFRAHGSGTAVASSVVLLALI